MRLSSFLVLLAAVLATAATPSLSRPLQASQAMNDSQILVSPSGRAGQGAIDGQVEAEEVDSTALERPGALSLLLWQVLSGSTVSMQTRDRSAVNCPSYGKYRSCLPNKNAGPHQHCDQYTRDCGLKKGKKAGKAGSPKAKAAPKPEATQNEAASQAAAAQEEKKVAKPEADKDEADKDLSQAAGAQEKEKAAKPEAAEKEADQDLSRAAGAEEEEVEEEARRRENYEARSSKGREDETLWT